MTPGEQKSGANPSTDTRQAGAPAGAGEAIIHIAGIGASAGGLEAFERFFRACPVDTGVAFVLVPHLDPDHRSLLTEILQRTTSMPIAEAAQNQPVVANHVYIVPPNREMLIRGGRLQISEPTRARGQRMPIDAFFRSLAAECASHAIGILLSGTATDGTLGLRAILDAGGVCIVQEPATAKYEGMPESAIAAGNATHIVPVEKMPALLFTITRQTAVRKRPSRILPAAAIDGLNQILLRVRQGTGHDFSLYKKSTMARRVGRRMAQHQIAELAVYARYLKENPAEVQVLFKELLINVSSFFRDPAAFEALRDEVLRPLLAGQPADFVFRAWVAGCASGEEAYSLAILLREIMEDTGQELKVQIYATDLDDDAIVEARAGRYPSAIAENVTPERLQQFFTRDGEGYKVAKSIRDMVIFAVQSVIKDPPFTRLDLLSCRNLLIYLEAEQQESLIPNFHFALKPGGVLFLSTSESIAGHSNLFRVINRKWKFYRASNAHSALHISHKSHEPNNGRAASADRKVGTPSKEIAMSKTRTRHGNVADLSNRFLLQSYAPASVTTDGDGNVLYIHGDVRKYLSPPPGPVTTNVFDMARKELQPDLRAAVFDAIAQGMPTLNREISLDGANDLSRISFSVRPLPTIAAGGGADNDPLLLISFQEAIGRSVRKRRGKNDDKSPEASRFEQMEHELAYAKENLQATIEEQQATNEELKSANEELQSTNEELQSANEELETSKEELQSLNEETITVNAELNGKIEQLNILQSDLMNLMDNVHTGMLFLDHQLAIRRYTREALRIFPLVASDVGRPLADIKSSLAADDDLLGELQTVLDTLIPHEREVRTADGAWFLARIQPYRTLDNFILGVVLTLTEVTDFKRASDAVQRSEALLVSAQAIAHLGSWEFDVATGEARWSEEMFHLFGYTPNDQVMPQSKIMSRLSAIDQERVARCVQASVSSNIPYDVEYRITRPDGAQRDVHSRAVPMVDASGRVTHLLGTSLDITEMRDAERLRATSLQLARSLADAIFAAGEAANMPLIVVDGDFQVISANRSFYRDFSASPERTLGRPIYDLGVEESGDKDRAAGDGERLSGRRPWDVPQLHGLLGSVLQGEAVRDSQRLEIDLPVVGRRRLTLNARRIGRNGGDPVLILLTVAAMAAPESV